MSNRHQTVFLMFRLVGSIIACVVLIFTCAVSGQPIGAAIAGLAGVWIVTAAWEARKRSKTAQAGHAEITPPPAPLALPNPYIEHALSLSRTAQEIGAPDLASAIRSVASTPHPSDKQQVALNYLRSVPVDTAQQHCLMFTQRLMMVPDGAASVLGT